MPRAMSGYADRVLLIYDGLHYDALAVAAFEGAPEELDVTCFEARSGGGAAIMAAAEKLVRVCVGGSRHSVLTRRKRWVERGAGGKRGWRIKRVGTGRRKNM